mgnify:CR=1 FL=1|jgi:Rrf2 family protein
MHLFAQEEYGLRCMLQLALHRGDEPLRIHDIAEREGMSSEYVAKLLRTLRQGGLVLSTRGASGGYHLSRAAEAISVWEIINVLGGGPMFSDAFCDSHPGQLRDCVHNSECAIRGLWRSLSELLEGALRGITLTDLTGREGSPVDWLTRMQGAAAGPVGD